MEKVISAISTASGVGGVAIIRLSGENVLDILEKMFKPLQKSIKVKDFEPYKLYVGEIDGGSFTDFGMAVFFKGPKSYTGEDMVEIHCHGGLAIQRGILKQTFNLGALPATKGEFTKRAFINGKLSLDSAEGLIDMINSESIAGVKVGYSLYREKLYNKINALQDGLTYSLASIDADIDYPEEDLEETALGEVKKSLD
ncbi:MAG: tRNA uridine-5-carboxymethylaminomethyl(34) synthesis GTPase MnmE, partial [Clostridia bacterium]|nr:tRNA uridine-5-carboxymethylaminomethyl(34) synthesis GTPase MnmE [Clostridia bacterium]